MTKLSVRYLLQRANSNLKKGEFAEAEKLYAEALMSFPNNAKARHGMISLSRVSSISLKKTPPQQLIDKLIGLVDEEKLDQVIEQAGNLLIYYPKSVALFNIVGIASAQLMRFDQAIDAFKKILTLTPDQASAHYNLGNVYKDKGLIQQSIAAYTKALELKPNYEEAFNNLIVVLKSYDQDAKKKQLDVIENYQKFQKASARVAEKYFETGVLQYNDGRLDEAVEAFKKSIEQYPYYAEAYLNMGSALQDQNKLEEAIASYKKALAINPDYDKAYNNMGNAFQDQNKLEEAIASYNKALIIKPDKAETYNNMGNALRKQGKLEEAIASYNKALAINPDNYKAYNNMGNAFQDQNKLEEAMAAFNKALAINPDFSKAHLSLSSLVTYNSEMAQISKVETLLERTDLKDAERCDLLYAHAKMHEDLGDFRSAFDSYVAGGNLMKKLLSYEFNKDALLFARIKQTAPKFKDIVLNATKEPIRHTPIFILGMPRSGTTLVEQVVSSHSEVAGAGELPYVSLFGGNLVAGTTAPTLKAVLAFREKYLATLAKKSDGKVFVTDKMPHNFRYIALIRAALPEAKIIHLQRKAKATCWSNFKQYFESIALGYSYNLGDTVRYYRLYRDLMDFWYQSYNDDIYNIDYDKLTEDQEPETRGLIEYLGLKWEDALLAPHQNKRSVRTASSQQVRRKVYTGSSEAWRKYEPFIDGIFDQLES